MGVISRVALGGSGRRSEENIRRTNVSKSPSVDPIRHVADRIADGVRFARTELASKLLEEAKASVHECSASAAQGLELVSKSDGITSELFAALTADSVYTHVKNSSPHQ